MQYKATILFSLIASAIALPTPADAPEKRAGVLSTQKYADFQVSDGKAGNALAEVQAKFPVRLFSLPSVLPMVDVQDSPTNISPNI